MYIHYLFPADMILIPETPEELSVFKEIDEIFPVPVQCPALVDINEQVSVPVEVIKNNLIVQP